MRKKIKKEILQDNIIKAIYGGNLQPVEEWLSFNNKESRDRDSRTSIHHAVLSRNEDIVKFLLESGVEVNVQDKFGLSPLHYAAQNYLKEIARLLIKNGAIVDAQDNYGNTPLGRAVFESQGKGDLIRLLLDYGADPNLINNAGVSPRKLAYTIANFNVKQFFD